MALPALGSLTFSLVILTFLVAMSSLVVMSSSVVSLEVVFQEASWEQALSQELGELQLMMSSKALEAQEVLWASVPSALVLWALPLVLVPIQYPSPHRHHSAKPYLSQSNRTWRCRTAFLHDLRPLSLHLH